MELSKKTKKYWQEKDWEILEKAKSMGDLGLLAMQILKRMPKPIVQVCGPIASGGLGSLETNLNAFNETIKNLQRQGLNVFDQMPFEAPMQKLKLISDGWVDSIQNDFYMPILKSGLVTKLYFMPNWQSSIGANWENKTAKELNIEIVYL